MSDDYPVGYRRPPAHSQFKPGQSGNPKGRPRGATNLREQIERELRSTVPVKTNGKARKVTKRAAIGMRVVHKAMEGDARAIATIVALDRPDPKAPGTAETFSPGDLEILQAYAADWGGDDTHS